MALLLLLAALLPGVVEPFWLRFKESITIRTLKDLYWDNERHLRDNWLLYLDNYHCQGLAKTAWTTINPAYRRIAQMPSTVSDFYFGLSWESRHCTALSLPRGTLFEHVAHLLDEQRLLLNMSSPADAFTEWLRAQTQAEVGWVSHSLRHKVRSCKPRVLPAHSLTAVDPVPPFGST